MDLTELSDHERRDITMLPLEFEGYCIFHFGVVLGLDVMRGIRLIHESCLGDNQGTTDRSCHDFQNGLVGLLVVDG